MRFIVLISGLLFGTGLILSGMTSPDRVLGFLDVTGAWDPSLAFVMGGGLLISVPFYAWSRKLGRAWNGQPVAAPARAGIDIRLVGGAALFGIGWGLSGLCPGPAMVDLAVAPVPMIVFVLPMLLGLLLSRLRG